MEEGEERRSKVTRKKTKSLEHKKPSSKRLDNLSLKVSMLTNSITDVDI